jgi:hypothetical protein
MKLRFESKTIKKGEDVEFPDFSFNHAYNTQGDKQVEIMYMVPSDEDSRKIAARSEIIAHLLGDYV